MNVEVVVARQLDGTTFSLTPESRVLVAEKARTPLVSQIFVGHPAEQEFSRLHGPIWEQIALVITSLTGAEIRELGGVTFLDSSGERLAVCFGGRDG